MISRVCMTYISEIFCEAIADIYAIKISENMHWGKGLRVPNLKDQANKVSKAVTENKHN